MDAASAVSETRWKSVSNEAQEVSYLSGLIAPSFSWIGHKIIIEQQIIEGLTGLIRKIYAFILSIKHFFLNFEWKSNSELEKEIQKKVVALKGQITLNSPEILRNTEQKKLLDQAFSEVRIAVDYLDEKNDAIVNEIGLIEAIESPKYTSKPILGEIETILEPFSPTEATTRTTIESTPCVESIPFIDLVDLFEEVGSFSRYHYKRLTGSNFNEREASLLEEWIFDLLLLAEDGLIEDFEEAVSELLQAASNSHQGGEDQFLILMETKILLLGLNVYALSHEAELGVEDSKALRQNIEKKLHIIQNVEPQFSSIWEINNPGKSFELPQYYIPENELDIAGGLRDIVNEKAEDDADRQATADWYERHSPSIFKVMQATHLIFSIVGAILVGTTPRPQPQILSKNSHDRLLEHHETENQSANDANVASSNGISQTPSSVTTSSYIFGSAATLASVVGIAFLRQCYKAFKKEVLDQDADIKRLDIVVAKHASREQIPVLNPFTLFLQSKRMPETWNILNRLKQMFDLKGMNSLFKKALSATPKHKIGSLAAPQQVQPVIKAIQAVNPIQAAIVKQFIQNVLYDIARDLNLRRVFRLPFKKKIEPFRIKKRVKENAIVETLQETPKTNSCHQRKIRAEPLKSINITKMKAIAKGWIPIQKKGESSHLSSRPVKKLPKNKAKATETKTRKMPSSPVERNVNSESHTKILKNVEEISQNPPLEQPLFLENLIDTRLDRSNKALSYPIEVLGSRDALKDFYSLINRINEINKSTGEMNIRCEFIDEVNASRLVLGHTTAELETLIVMYPKLAPYFYIQGRRCLALMKDNTTSEFEMMDSDRKLTFRRNFQDDALSCELEILAAKCNETPKIKPSFTANPNYSGTQEDHASLFIDLILRQNLQGVIIGEERLHHMSKIVLIEQMATLKSICEVDYLFLDLCAIDSLQRELDSFFETKKASKFLKRYLKNGCGECGDTKRSYWRLVQAAVEAGIRPVGLSTSRTLELKNGNKVIDAQANAATGAKIIEKIAGTKKYIALVDETAGTCKAMMLSAMCNVAYIEIYDAEDQKATQNICYDSATLTLPVPKFVKKPKPLHSGKDVMVYVMQYINAGDRLFESLKKQIVDQLNHLQCYNSTLETFLDSQSLKFEMMLKMQNLEMKQWIVKNSWRKEVIHGSGDFGQFEKEQKKLERLIVKSINDFLLLFAVQLFGEFKEFMLQVQYGDGIMRTVSLLELTELTNNLFNTERIAIINEHKLWKFPQEKKVELEEGSASISEFEPCGEGYTSGGPRNRKNNPVLPNFFCSRYRSADKSKPFQIFKDFEFSRSATISEFFLHGPEREKVNLKLVEQALQSTGDRYLLKHQEKLKNDNEVVVPFQWVALLTDALAPKLTISLGIHDSSKDEESFLRETIEALEKCKNKKFVCSNDRKKSFTFDIKLWNVACNDLQGWTTMWGWWKSEGSNEKICNENAWSIVKNDVCKAVEILDKNIGFLNDAVDGYLISVVEGLIKNKRSQKALIYSANFEKMIPLNFPTQHNNYIQAADALANVTHQNSQIQHSIFEREYLDLIAIKECILDLRDDLHFIITNKLGDASLDNNLHATSSRLIALGNLLGYAEHVTCRSGKDRTSEADNETKLLIQITEKLGRCPTYWEMEKLPFIDHYRDKMALESGNFDLITEANLGADLGPNLTSCANMPYYEGKNTPEWIEGRKLFLNRLMGATTIFKRPVIT